MPPSAPGGFPVVGIGASAGGLEAFGKLLEALPADTGIAFVLIPHLEPTHASMMVDLLGLHTTMTVMQVADGMAIESNRVYVIPPQAYLSVRDGRLRLSAPAAPHGARLPFDFFLHSLAEEYGERAVCVVLSGTGADGSTGLKAVGERGGLVIAQDPAEAAYDGMPRNAIATGSVHLVLSVAQIPDALLRYSRHPCVTATGLSRQADESEDRLLGDILELLRARTSRDFTQYRKPTLLRRIRRRMAAAGIRNIADYMAALRQEGVELQLLAEDFLIHVTGFFRDPAAFEGLAKTVIPELVARVGEEPIRVWVPGCSSGEEAYSLAILFFEEFATQKRTPRLQIFASDISEEALALGREGLYPESIKGDVSAERLQQFFAAEERGYQVSRQLRDTIVFTVHDLLVDPPFSRLDLISCRNLLIYLQPEEQQKVLSLFHFGLNDTGYLFLGVSETISQLGGLFEPTSNTLRIYRAVRHGATRTRMLARDMGERARALWPRLPERAGQRAPGIGETASRLLLSLYAPAAVLVDRNYRALYFFGPTDRYLHVASGEPSQDILPMLREGLAPRFRTVVRQAGREHSAVSVGGVRVTRNGDHVSVRITARPVPHDGEQLLLVTFEDEPERKVAETPETPEEASRMEQLEQELEDTRRELESTIRELEVSNQELSAMNEEALSINEEFQSTNEELETSREELQSLNEELTTTNAQLHETLDRQRSTADDLQNILNSSDLATLFLDENLNIRFFTPSAAAIFNIIASDIGRPLADLANPLTGLDPLGDAREVLAKLAPLRREVRSQTGAWYQCVTSPYRTRDNHIQGVVITLSNISGLKAEEEEARAARAYAEAIIDTIHEPLVVFDAAMQVVSASKSFYEYFEAAPADTIGRHLPDTDAHHLDVPALRAFLDRVQEGDGAPQSSEIELDLPGPWQDSWRTLILTAARVRDSGPNSKVLLTFNDITDFRRSELQRIAAQQGAEQANRAKSHFLAAVSHDLRQPLQTLTFLLGSLRPEVSNEGLSLFERAQDTLATMSNMLNALLDINQLESGNIVPEPVDFPIDDLLGRLDSEYGLHARAQGLDWRTVRSRISVHSDPRLLEGMLRNLLSNAIRYTERGGVLLGCRRRGENVSIEVWDTGIGIADQDIPNIFGEYQRVAAPEEGALGLGLAIVARLSELLGHPISVRSRLRRGSVFAIEVPRARGKERRPARRPRPAATIGRPARRGNILVIDDDPSLREALQSSLTSEGHHVASAANGHAALALVAENAFQPDLVVSDYLLPGGMTGVQTVQALRRSLGRDVPVVFLTGDIRRAGQRELRIAASILLVKPARQELVSRAVQQLLAESAEKPAAPPARPGDAGAPPAIFVADDDRGMREAIRELLTRAGYRVETFADGEALLAADRSTAKGCLIIDVRMPGMSGFELLARLAALGNTLPAIMVTGHGDIAMAVRAMQAGAVDFIEKPVQSAELLASIERALRQAADPSERSASSAAAALRIAGLTTREREVMDFVVDGLPNKEIAARLGIAQRTVETHRASVMEKMGAASLSDLVRMTLMARSGR
jgi:two-component system CheB/CheR fusion protein